MAREPVYSSLVLAHRAEALSTSRTDSHFGVGLKHSSAPYMFGITSPGTEKNSVSFFLRNCRWDCRNQKEDELPSRACYLRLFCYFRF